MQHTDLLLVMAKLLKDQTETFVNNFVQLIQGFGLGFVQKILKMGVSYENINSNTSVAPIVNEEMVIA